MRVPSRKIVKKKLPAIEIARVYDRAAELHGYRVLVDRLWPRGIKKVDLELDAWLKEVAPSHELRRWFAHDAEKWKEFRTRYLAELRKGSEQLSQLVGAAQKQPVVLLYSAHDEEHNQAVVLREFLLRKLRRKA